MPKASSSASFIQKMVFMKQYFSNCTQAPAVIAAVLTTHSAAIKVFFFRYPFAPITREDSGARALRDILEVFDLGVVSVNAPNERLDLRF